MAETDIDFSQVKDIKIPQGVVNYITEDIEGETRLLWKRPFKFPTYNVYFRANLTKQKVIVRNLPWGLRDEYGRSKILGEPPTSTNSDGSLNVYFQDSVIWLPTEDDVVLESDYTSPHTWIKHGVCGIYFKKASNNDNVGETEAITFSPNWPKAYPGLNFGNPGPTMKLYAVPELFQGVLGPVGDWVFGHLQKTEPYGEYVYKPREHETDVILKSAQCLIQETYINSADKNYIGINKFCSNFDWYKDYYDKVTEGKFPKSTYPYLVGVEPLVCFNYPNSKKALKSTLDDGLMYIGFKVKR